MRWKRGRFALPRGSVSFALWTWQLSFSLPAAPFIFPAALLSTVMIELYLAARLVYLLGLITAPGAGRGAKEVGGWGGSKIQTDRQVIYFHLPQSFHIDLASLHQQPDAGTPGFIIFSPFFF